MARWILPRHRQPLQKILESVGRHFGVPDRVLDVLVSKVVLQGARVVAVVGQLEPAGMAQHVRCTQKPAEVPVRKFNEFNARSSQKLRMP